MKKRKISPSSGIDDTYALNCLVSCRPDIIEQCVSTETQSFIIENNTKEYKDWKHERIKNMVYSAKQRSKKRQVWNEELTVKVVSDLWYSQLILSSPEAFCHEKLTNNMPTCLICYSPFHKTRSLEYSGALMSLDRIDSSDNSTPYYDSSKPIHTQIRIVHNKCNGEKMMQDIRDKNAFLKQKKCCDTTFLSKKIEEVKRQIIHVAREKKIYVLEKECVLCKKVQQLCHFRWTNDILDGQIELAHMFGNECIHCKFHIMKQSLNGVKSDKCLVCHADFDLSVTDPRCMYYHSQQRKYKIDPFLLQNFPNQHIHNKCCPEWMEISIDMKEIIDLKCTPNRMEEFINLCKQLIDISLVKNNKSFGK